PPASTLFPYTPLFRSLVWDGEVVYQSRRLDAYESALASLQAKGLAYPCVCSRRQLAEQEESGYPGTCRSRTAVTVPSATRFRVDDSAHIRWIDRFQGECGFSLRKLGDVIVKRRDGVFAYQLAVVIDDAWQGVTDVVRGADLLESTAWQIALQRAIALPTPRYAHLPLVIEPDGAKLSKSRRSFAASAEQPGAMLVTALRLLRHEPPPGLEFESASTVLDWGIRHWNPTRFQHVLRVSAPAH